MRKPGLLHGPRRIEVETVKKAHRKPCEGCGSVPCHRRLKVVNGAGRSADTLILCISCGLDYLSDRRDEYQRAQDFLHDGACEDGDGIRLPKLEWEVTRDRMKREKAKARKEKA